MSWAPSDAGSNLKVALDVPGAYRAGKIWQDSGKTTPATKVGDVVAKITDDWSGLDWTFTGSPVLSYFNNTWELRFSGGTMKGSVTVSFGTPFTVGYRWHPQNFAASYNIPFSGGSNVIGIGYDDTGHLFNFTSTGFATSGSVVTDAMHTVLAVCATSSAQIRHDGSQVATGTNTTASVSSAGVATNGASGLYNGYLRRLVLMSGDQSALATQIEAWLQGGADVTLPAGPNGPILMFSFDSATEALRVYQTANGLDWFDTGASYSPPAGTVRDPDCVGPIPGGYYFGYTRDGFNQSQTFAIARATTFPTSWAHYVNVLCSECYGSSGSGNRCWFSDLYYEGNTLYALFSTSDDGDSGATGSFKMWYKTSTYPFTSWTSAVQFTGTAIGSNAIDHHIYKLGSTYHLLWKNETSDVLAHSSNSSLTGSGWNSGGDYGSPTGPIEGAGIILIPTLAGGDGATYWVFANRYGGTGLRRFTTTDFSSLGSEAGVTGGSGFPNSNPYLSLATPTFAPTERPRAVYRAASF